MHKQGDAAKDYNVLATHRSTALQRARDASRVTIPGLIPLEGQNEHFVQSQPYQSVGARGVANLASRLILTAFPPNLAPFRLGIAEDVAKDLGSSLGDANAKLGIISGVTYGMMEEYVLRPVMGEAFRHLVVAGNVLVHIPEGEKPRIYRLDQYVVRRDHTGQFMTIIVKELITYSALTTEQRAAVTASKPGNKPKADDDNDEYIDGEEMLEVYTQITIQSDLKTAKWWQEINGLVVPGTEGSAPRESCGWYPLRWLAVPGSDYGRSHVTEYIGDLLSLEDLSEAMVKFAAEAARIIHVVDPNSGIDVEELAAAETGDYITGYADRIKTLQLEKPSDWQVINQLSERIEARVSNAFLLRSSAVRNAERVTAEEIRMIAEELDTVLGGTYSIMAAELQLPLVHRFMYLAVRKGRIPKLPASIRPIITTGFDALGRASSVASLRMFLQDLGQAIGEQQVLSIIQPEEVARRFGEGYNIPALEDLIKSSDQRAQEQQQAATATTAQNIAPDAVKAMIANQQQNQ